MNDPKTEELQDKMMAMEFAFSCLARSLHQRGVLPIPQLQEHLQQVAEQLMDDNPSKPEESLHGVAVQLSSLHDLLGQLQ